MHLKELTHRSPLRVFERSVHGGVGKGNIGVVCARTGVGKTAFLTCVALDDLLRDRKVLHVTTGQTVDHVRAYYDEVFADLARETHLEETHVALDKIEHNRFIRSLNGRGFDATSLQSALSLLRTEVGFRPDVLIVDGYDFEKGTPDTLSKLRDVAREHGCEVWMTARVTKEESEADWHELPASVAKMGALVSVVVLLQPVGDAIRIRLVKDHDNPDVADLTLDLDPKTFLIKQA
jgi:hypothetical protein